MNTDGELVVNSSRHRTQKCARASAAAALPTALTMHVCVASRQNYEDALEKLQAMIDTAATPPTGPSDETIQKVKTLYVARPTRDSSWADD